MNTQPKINVVTVCRCLYCLRGFLSSGAKCPADVNIKQFSNLIRLYEHHTRLMGRAEPPPFTVCGHPSNDCIYLFIYFPFPRVACTLCWHPKLRFGSVAVALFSSLLFLINCKHKCRGWSVTQCSLLCQDDFKQV